MREGGGVEAVDCGASDEGEKGEGRRRECRNLSIDDTSCRGGYGLEVGSATLDEVVEDRCPVVAHVPGDLGRGIDLDRHHLRDTTALHDDHQSPNPSTLSASLLPSLDILNDEWVANVSSRNDVCRSNGESAMRFRVVMVAQIDKQRALADVGWNALELESLESSPAEECGVCGSKLAEVLREVLVGVSRRSCAGF